MNSSWLITSELVNQRTRKVLFTCVVYTKCNYLLVKYNLHFVACHIIETEENKLREASLAASSRLKRALLKEKETKDSLQKALNETQVCVYFTVIGLFVGLSNFSFGNFLYSESEF